MALRWRGEAVYDVREEKLELEFELREKSGEQGGSGSERLGKDQRRVGSGKLLDISFEFCADGAKAIGPADGQLT